jgi:hypothetical protein
VCVSEKSIYKQKKQKSKTLKTYSPCFVSWTQCREHVKNSARVAEHTAQFLMNPVPPAKGPPGKVPRGPKNVKPKQQINHPLDDSVNHQATLGDQQRANRRKDQAKQRAGREHQVGREQQTH